MSFRLIKIDKVKMNTHFAVLGIGFSIAYLVLIFIGYGMGTTSDNTFLVWRLSVINKWILLLIIIGLLANSFFTYQKGTGFSGWLLSKTWSEISLLLTLINAALTSLLFVIPTIVLIAPIAVLGIGFGVIGMLRDKQFSIALLSIVFNAVGLYGYSILPHSGL